MSAPSGPAPRRRRLRDRLPVRLRHHWKPVAAVGVGLAAMAHFLGDARIAPYVTSASQVEADPITHDVQGPVKLYDPSVTHTVRLSYRQTDFDKMMKEFTDEGGKEYIEADLVIDGVRLDDVGIRLKGNSTLSSLRGGRGMPGERETGRETGREIPAGGGELPGGGPGTAAGGAGGGGATGGAGTSAGAGAGGATDGAGTAPGGGARNQGAPGGAGGPGGMGGMVRYDLSASKPEELPWLIKIDEFVEGRAYQGEREISLRPGSGDAVPLNEALSLSLTAQSGQKTERYGFAKVTVNNRPTATRLMVESPDTDYAESIGDGNGVLYKAKAGGSFAYRGDDPTEYTTSFEQLNKKGSRDLEPLIRLIRWVDGASDEEFERELDQYVDVGSLASYLATQNLLMNFDDMAGPGKNYLLWYDLGTRKFSVLGWDYNLAFSGDATAGPEDSAAMGPFPGERQGAGGAGTAPGGTPGGAPEGMPEGIPEGAPQPPGGAAPGAAPGGGPPGGEPPGADGGRGGPAMGHALKTRFLESDAFKARYQETYRTLYEKFYRSGSAAGDLRDLAERAEAAGAGSGQLDTTVTRLAKTVADRTAALKEKVGSDRDTGQRATG
ncbi:CotH kinase family protein [Streptomyces sp. NPDC094448]|uniref:CotH kinase family protein n=1 Tax=Streptomyces sp. NPDC094448 TaxID=3366063 RepID=UPI003806D5B6